MTTVILIICLAGAEHGTCTWSLMQSPQACEQATDKALDRDDVAMAMCFVRDEPPEGIKPGKGKPTS